jgi:ABC-2 type transport system permease protein
MQKLRYYLRVWLRLTLSSFQVAFVSRFGAIIFTIAKLLRFGLFYVVIVMIMSKTQKLSGYSVAQSLIFFLTYNVIDTITQLLFRDVYRFQPKIVSGDFDMILIKPMSPLFRVLLGGADPLDLVVLLPYLIILGYLLTQVPHQVFTVILYGVLLINAFLISAAFHIIVLALGILTTEIDHAIMIYRDIASMARFPIDIYREPLRGFITFIVPVGIMMTFPPKALFGLLTLPFVGLSVLIGIGALGTSVFLWRFALTRYTSASS